MKLRDRVNKI